MVTGNRLAKSHRVRGKFVDLLT